MTNITNNSSIHSKSPRIFPWILAAFLCAGYAGLQVSTQYVAHTFHYQMALGTHIHHVYAPWSVILWANKWMKLYPETFIYAINVGIISSLFIILIVAFVWRFFKNSARKHVSMHGSARWANEQDIKKTGLLGNKGVYVGAFINKRGELRYLRHNGPEHILTYAPTRSGKGLGLVLPTLLSWPDSAVITDLKGELWAMTAGWRQKYAGNKVIRFEPASNQSVARFNPLDEIRIATAHEVGDVQNLATLIVDPDGKGLQTHWQTTSQSLLVGLILHVLYKRRCEGLPATLPEVDRILVDPVLDIAGLWEEMGNYPHKDGKPHPVISAAARDMKDREEEEACSILSTVKTHLALYRDPVVAENVSVSDFSVRDLMHHDSPVSLYIITQPNDMTRLRPLIRMVLNLIIRLLADKMEFERTGYIARNEPVQVRQKKPYKHRLLAMIDEFPSLGKLEILQQSLAFVAGYGIKFYLICQDINQLKSRESGYGQDESITSNCHVQNAYPPNRVETAEYLSRSLGTTTVIKEQITTSGKRGALVMEQVSRTFQESQRPLLTPDECARMPGPEKNADGMITKAGDMIVYVAGCPAIYGKQPLYFQDPVFMARAAVESPACTDKTRLVKKLSERERVLL